MRTTVNICLLVIFVVQGCTSSSVRTYKNYKLDPAYEWVWMLNLQNGGAILFYDFGRMEMARDSLIIKGSSNRSPLAMNDIASIEKISTTRSQGTAVGLGIVGSLVGGYVVGKLAASKVKENKSDGLQFLAGRAVMGGLGMLAGLIAGAMAGAAIGHGIESASSRQVIDLSELSVEARAFKIGDLKRQYPSRISTAGYSRFVQIERRDGSVIEGEVALLMDKELIIIRTSGGDTTIPWADIKSLRRIVEPTNQKEKQP